MRNMHRSELINKRNETLIKDFDDLYNRKRKRLDDVLKELSERYFIAEDTVYSLVFYNKKNKQQYEALLKEQ
jgi:hypothetical protein